MSTEIINATKEALAKVTLTKQAVLSAEQATREAICNPKTAYEVATKETLLKAAEREYNEAVEGYTYCKFMEAENPMLEAIKTYDFDIVKHSFEKDDNGKPTALVMQWDAKKTIALETMAAKTEVKSEWKVKAIELAANVIASRMGENEFCGNSVALIGRSFGLEEKAMTKSVSTTQITKSLQEIANLLVKEDGLLKVINRDAKYFNTAMLSVDLKKKQTYSTTNKKGLMRALLEIFNRIACGGAYGVDNKFLKKEDATALMQKIRLAEAEAMKEEISKMIKEISTKEPAKKTATRKKAKKEEQEEPKAEEVNAEA